VASVQELLKEARRLDLSSTQACFRLGDLAEALHHELPKVVDLVERLAIDLEVDRDIINQAWFVAGAFPPPTRHPDLPWATYVSLRSTLHGTSWPTKPPAKAGTRIASARSSPRGSPPTITGRRRRTVDRPKSTP
jgi:hypothetical protein